MTQKEYDLIVYIGRFQPFHDAHRETVQRASNIANHTLVLVGSSNTARSPKNPFTFEERADMIRESVGVLHLHILPLKDYTYDDNMWIQEVGKLVDATAGNIGAKKIAVIGHDKDHSSFYLNFFPQWHFIPMPSIPIDGDTIDATKIRDLWYRGDYRFIRGVLPDEVYDEMRGFSGTKEFTLLVEEWEYIEEYKKSWAAAPYTPTFNTVDAIVIQSGHVLLVQRGINPGKGNWAMPGGFLDPNERIIDGAIRELREETRLKVPEKVLRGSIKHQEVFDDPGRSSRGRTITHAFLFKLDDREELPRVKGSDDAMDARWVSLSEFQDMEPVMNEDHWHIINHMLNQ